MGQFFARWDGFLHAGTVFNLYNPATGLHFQQHGRIRKSKSKQSNNL